MASLGTPVCGDRKYGEVPVARQIELRRTPQEVANWNRTDKVGQDDGEQIEIVGLGNQTENKASVRNSHKHLALWAYELGFNHPTSGERLRFVVNPPEIDPWMEFDFERKSHKTRGNL